MVWIIDWRSIINWLPRFRLFIVLIAWIKDWEGVAKVVREVIGRETAPLNACSCSYSSQEAGGKVRLHVRWCFYDYYFAF